MHPPNPEKNRAALADGPVRIDSDFSNIQPDQITATARQAQHLRRLYALTSSVANAVAELAFAGLPR